MATATCCDRSKSSNRDESWAVESSLPSIPIPRWFSIIIVTRRDRSSSCRRSVRGIGADLARAADAASPGRLPWVGWWPAVSSAARVGVGTRFICED